MLNAGAPAGIVVVSAHWRANFDGVLVSHGGGNWWGTLHDHPASGMYDWTYKAAQPTSEQSELVRQTLLSAALDARFDTSWDQLDHGAWIALHSLWSDEAPCPVIQVSLHGAHEGVAANYLLGKALAGLRSRGMLIVTSGSVTHNQDEFRKSFLASRAPMHDWTLEGRQQRREACDRSVPLAASVAFDERVKRAVLSRDDSTLLDLHKHSEVFAPAHPEPSHWLPLIVALGVAGEGEAAEEVHAGFQHGLSETAFVWGLSCFDHCC